MHRWWIFSVFLFYMMQIVHTSHFRGGIFTWRSTDNKDEVSITFRMSWRRSFSSATYCDQDTINHGGLIANLGSISCFGCDHSFWSNTDVIMTDTSFVCTDYSVLENWTQGERTFLYNFGNTSGRFDFGFTGGAWITLVQGGGNWEMRTTVDLHIRNDTGLINSSPTSAMPPIVRLEYGCNHTIKIPVYDPDKDIVRCRWAKASLHECGGVCSSFTNAFLHEDRCEITYNAVFNTGWYAVAIQIEDFNSVYSTNPLSSIPLQFLVLVSNSQRSCSSKPSLIYPSPNDGECISVPLNSTWYKQIVAIAGAEGVRINEINTVSPPGLIKSSLEQYNSSREWYVNVTWTPRKNQTGVHLFCFSANDEYGMVSERRCIHLIAGVEPPSVIPFYPNYTISVDQKNLTMYFDSMISKPVLPAHISIFKSNGVLVSQLNAQDSADVHYPVQTNDSHTWIITIVLKDIALEGNTDYYITMDQGVAKGLEGCGGESKAVYNTSILSFHVGDETTIRLVGGKYSWEGRVEVYHNGEWGTVCDDYFNYDEALIVCRMLGFANTSVHYFGSAFYGPGNGKIWMRFFSCSGEEKDIVSCMSGTWNPGGCSHSEDVGVSCDMQYSSGAVSGVSTPSIYSTPVRLVGGRYGWEGRIEVLHNGHWGTVCDDSFDKSDGDVICKMLGYSSASTVWSHAMFGAGNGNIWLDELGCFGYETSIENCTSNGWGIHDCSHSEDASVRCNINVYEQTTDEKRELMTESSTIVCFNGGYASERFGFWSCQCPFGYTGNYCEHSVTTYSPCNSYPCYNGGVCYNRNYGYPSFYCSCPSGYSGNDCSQYLYQTSYDPCYSQPCRNGGTCYQYGSTYYCNCLNGYSGQNCDISSTENAVSVACPDNSWNIRLYLPSLYDQYSDFDPYDVYLGQDSCNGTVNGNYLIFQPDYTECNTLMKMSLDNIIYTNKLIYALHDPIHHFIVREYRFQINVVCYLPRSEGNSGHFNHGIDVTSSIYVNGSGHHQVHLQFYTDSSFTQIKPLYGSRVGDTVYVKATSNVRDYNIKMKLSDCFTTPTYNSDPSLRYFIIRNGCVIDPNARILSQSIHETRFYFQDFEYSMNHDSLYIHCNATFCKSNDYSAKCEQRCHHFFKRIGGGNVINDGPFASSEVNQAIRMKKGNSNSGSESSSSVAVNVISVIAGLLLVVIITALMLTLKKRRQLTQQGDL